MKVTRIYTGEDGASRFEELDIPIADAGGIGRLSAPLAAKSMILRENDKTYDWHCAPVRQYIILLDGEIEIEVGSGERRRFRGGDVLLVEDTTGRGHCTRQVSVGTRRSVFVVLG